MISPRDVAATALVCLVLGASCTNERASLSPSPELAPIDTVLLQEPGEVFIGLVNGFAVVPSDGGYLVSDQQNHVVHQFERDGRYRRSLGRAGQGPGEFQHGPGYLALIGDSLLLARTTPVEVQVINLRSGEFLPAMQTPPALGFTISAGPATLYFPLIDAGARTTAGALDLNGGTVRRGGPFPRPLVESPLLGRLGIGVTVGSLGRDSVAIAVQSSDFLFWGRFAQQRFDSILVPVLQRRGSRPEVWEQVFTGSKDLNPLDVFTPSHPVEVRRLPSGYLAVVVNDIRMQPETFQYVATGFISVIDIQGRRVCADARIPGLADTWPRSALLGDTLHVIAQEVVGDKALTKVRRYLLVTDRCQWWTDRPGGP